MPIGIAACSGGSEASQHSPARKKLPRYFKATKLNGSSERDEPDSPAATPNPEGSVGGDCGLRGLCDTGQHRGGVAV